MRAPALVTLLLGASAHADVPLDELLQRLGEAEERKLALSACRSVESSVTEQVDKKGTVEGRLTRSYEVVRSGGAVVSRKLLSEKEEGDLASQLKAPPKDPSRKEGDKPRLSPFHPQARADYHFESAPGPGEGLVTVKFAPVKADKQRMQGQAVVDARTGKEQSVSMSPSVLPTMVDALQMDFLAYSDTPCGRQPTRMKLSGSGGLLVYKVRFRSEVTMSEHQKVDAPGSATDTH
jgi:hypothetical protein